MTAVNLIAIGCAIGAYFYGRWQFHRGFSAGWSGRSAIASAGNYRLSDHGARRLLHDIRHCQDSTIDEDD